MRRQDTGKNKEAWAEVLRGKVVVFGKELICGHSLVLPDISAQGPCITLMTLKGVGEKVGRDLQASIIGI